MVQIFLSRLRAAGKVPATALKRRAKGNPGLVALLWTLAECELPAEVYWQMQNAVRGLAQQQEQTLLEQINAEAALERLFADQETSRPL